MRHILSALTVLSTLSCVPPPKKPSLKPLKSDDVISLPGDESEGGGDSSDEDTTSDGGSGSKGSKPNQNSKPGDDSKPDPSKPDDSMQTEPTPMKPKPVLEIAKLKNPIMIHGADPWVVERDGWYYHCFSDGGSKIMVRRTRKMGDMEAAKIVTVWHAPEGKPYSKETWAPEMHWVQGKWYIYFAADDGKNENHRMFVLESKTDDAMGEYTLKSEIKTDNWAIDGTVWEHKKKLYFLWSGWPGLSPKQQNIYIAPMKDPWTLVDNSSFKQRLEAEDGKVQKAEVQSSNGASNGKLVGKIDFPESSVTVTAKVPAAGDYAFEIIYGAGFEGGATMMVSANGGKEEKIVLPAMGWQNRQIMTARVNLKNGDNQITVRKGDGYAELDAFVVKEYGKDPVAISVPERDWERRGGPDYVNEGPQMLENKGKTFVIYSASGSWMDDYCLGQLTLVGDDPMSSQAWQKHTDGCVFGSANDVYGPGHASFVKTPDGAEDWIVYHAAKKKGSGWDRNVRTQKFGWNADGSPNFGKPRDISDEQDLPFQKD